MPAWEELFKMGAALEGVEAEVAAAARLLRDRFPGDPQNIAVWDIGCGTGRHTAYLAHLGFSVYASDNAPTALAKTRGLLAAEGLSARLAEADMEEVPFGDTIFHGIVIWKVVQHATSPKIARVIANLKDHLLSGGILVLNVKSTKAEEAGQGEELEEGTYVMAEGPEAGVPHHYFSKDELDGLLAPLEIIHLVEVQENIFATATSRLGIKKYLPYHNAHWSVMARKTESDF
jgi:SAM-dependent methyltransferase